MISKSTRSRLQRRLFAVDAVRRLARPFASVRDDARWVFILGCYNSGTTLLSDLMANHHDCAGLPGEGAFLTAELITPEQLGWVRMWWKAYEQMLEFGHGGGGDAEIVKRDWAIHYGKKSPIYLEKSISNAVRIPWIVANFPGARFVYIVRNGYAVAEGLRRKSGRGQYALSKGLESYPIEWCAQQWVKSSEVVEGELAKLPGEQVLSLQYEAFCADPSSWLQRIGEFVGADQLAQQSLDHVRNMNEKSIRSLSDDDLRQINQVAAATLRRHDYALLGEAS